MSTALFSRNADLKRLRDEGYFVEVTGGSLVMREVPYVNSRREVKLGTLTSSLCLTGDVTQKPEPHTVIFEGEFPCDADGTPIRGIGNSAGAGVQQHMLSSKPGPQGYDNYFQKMSTYATILSGPAAVLNPELTPRVFRTPDAEEDSVFHYVENASGRAGITALTARLMPERVAIVGVGGTGSYILDLVAKCPVREVRLIDGDDLQQHNAFRAPGAPSIEKMREVIKKVDYFIEIYSRMHRFIFPNRVMISEANTHLLDGITFAFICMDAGDGKRVVVEKLEQLDIPFIDVGMGLELVDGTLGGILRVTTSVPGQREHFRERVSFAADGVNDVYASNIQVADLNMLNAALAVIKWKKLRGFYRDLEGELHCSYTTDGNMLLNGKSAC
jgi:hypothetical protein